VPLAFRLAAQGPGRRGVPQDVGRYALLDLAVALHRARLSGPRSVRCTRGITPPPLNDPSRRNLSDPGAK
jgi:hypothetical protein